MTIQGTTLTALTAGAFPQPRQRISSTDYQPTAYPAQVESPKFGGVTDLIAKGVAWISASKPRELIFTDFTGMTGPRSAAELIFRGPDMFREAMIREVPGAVIPVFAVGWLGALMAPLLNTATLWGNPHGIYSKGWVNAKSLQIFQKLFDQAIETSGSTAEARDKLVRRVIEDLVASDQNTLETTWATLEKQGQPDLANRLRQAYKGRMTNNQLSHEAIEALVSTFQHHADPTQGMMAIHEQVAQYAASDAVRGLSGRSLTKALNQKRLELSKAAAQHYKTLAEARYSQAIEGGLTEVVHVGEHARNQPLKMVLQDLHYFLEQYADRAMAHPETGKITRSTFDKARVLEQLFKSPKRGLIQRWTPTIEDGLVTYAVKSKRLLVAIPLVLSTAAAVSVAFINNEITRRKLKDGGFPGEKVFQASSTPSAGITSLYQGRPDALTLKPSKLFSRLLDPTVSKIHLPNAALAPGLAHISPRFGNMAGLAAVPGWLQSLDYQFLGESLLAHSFIVYTIQNVGRAIAAGKRSWNEVREATTRDVMGTLFWFFAGGLTRMGVVRFIAPKVAKDLLLVKNPEPAGGLAKLLWQWVPSRKFSFATSGQMAERMVQMEKALTKSGLAGDALAAAKKPLEAILVNGGKKWRLLADAVGITNTVLLLGIGIPVYNILMTRRNVEKGKVGKW
jgi:hypothetical protein